MSSILQGPILGSAPFDGAFTWSAVALAFALGATTLGIRAAVESGPSLMSPSQLAQAGKAIDAETRLALAGCRDLAGVEKDVCRATSRAEERVKRAELQARYYGTVAAQDEARAARTKAAFEIARARCAAQLPAERLNCLRAAREDRGKSANDEKVAARS